MDSVALRSVVHAAVVEHAASLGLDARTRAGEVRENRGGFVNASYHATDGVSRAHIKVARDAECSAKLRRWARHGAYLSAEYCAPRILCDLGLASAERYALALVFAEGDALVALDAPGGEDVNRVTRALHVDTAFRDILLVESGLAVTNCRHALEPPRAAYA